MHDLIKKLEDFFAKAPHLPNDIREIIVKVAPYLAIIGIVFSVPAIFALFGIGLLTAPVMMMGGHSGVWMLAGVFAVANLVLLVLAFPGLKAHTQKGWMYTFYSVLLGAVQSLLSFNFVGLVVFTTLELYILFEVKSHYHGGSSHGHHEGGEHHNHHAHN